MNDHAVTAVAPSGCSRAPARRRTAASWFNCNNPLAQRATGQYPVLPGRDRRRRQRRPDLGTPHVEGGALITYETELPVVAGARGEIPQLRSWKYDVYGQYCYTSLYQSNTNYLSNSRNPDALQVVNVNGAPTCIAKVTGADPNCVPYNIFAEGGVTPAQVAI